MTAKEYLMQLRNLERYINVKSLECERLETMATKMTSQLSDCKVETTPDKSKNENLIIQISELKREVKRQYAGYLELYDTISREIEGMEDMRFKTILTMRYINGANFEKVSDALGYEKRWTLVLHSRALKAFEEKYLY